MAGSCSAATVAPAGRPPARRRVLQQCLEPLLAAVGSKEEVARLPGWRQVESRIPA